MSTETEFTERMPGDAEAAVAIASLTGWRVDDRLSFTLPGDFRTIAARVALIRGDGWLVVEADDGEGFYSICPDWAWGAA